MNKFNKYLWVCTQNVVSMMDGVTVLTIGLLFDTSVVIYVSIYVCMYFNVYFNPVLVRTFERVTDRIWKATAECLLVSEEPD